MSKLQALPPKQRRFVEEYLQDLNATQAAIRAGYSKKTAKEQGCQLLTKLNIAEAVAELVERRSKRAEVRADQVIAELARMGFANMMDYIRILDDGSPAVDLTLLDRDKAAGIVDFDVADFKDGRGEEGRDVQRIKIRLNDKFRPLVKLGEHLGLFKGPAEIQGEGPDLAQLRADEQLRVEKMRDVTLRFVPKAKAALDKPKKAEKVKAAG